MPPDVRFRMTTFTRDFAALLPVELDDGNRYLYGAGLSAMKQSGNWFYYLADGLGSAMAVVDASGAVQKSYQYDVYGEVTGGSGSLANEFEFAGQQTDATGLQYLRARYYDPASGVFLSRDPLATFERWTFPPFGYSANPAGYGDPTGLCSYSQCPWLWKKVASTVLESHKWSPEMLDAGWLTPVVRHIKGKLGAGVCVKVVSCEYRVTKVVHRNEETGEERTIIKHEFFLNLEIGVGVGAFGVGYCAGLVSYDWKLPGPPPRGASGSW